MAIALVDTFPGCSASRDSGALLIRGPLCLATMDPGSAEQRQERCTASGTRDGSPLPHHLAQLGLQHLTVIIFGQRVEIHVSLRPLETRDRGAAMRVELGVVGHRP